MFAILLVMPKLSMRLPQYIKQLVFPPACPLCHQVYDRQDQTQGCCASCLQSVHIMPKHTCQSCGKPVPASIAPGPCGQCLKHPLPQSKTMHLYLYQGSVRQAILHWKLQGQSAGLEWLLQAAEPRLKQIFGPDDLLLPVPMPLPRMRSAGLHHAADLCRRIARVTGSRVCWAWLRRTGNHARQSSLGGKQRQRNLRKAFQLSDANPLPNMSAQGKVWVIDDILTTGATLRHACKVVRAAQSPVFAFALARTPSKF